MSKLEVRQLLRCESMCVDADYYLLYNSNMCKSQTIEQKYIVTYDCKHILCVNCHTTVK